MKILHFSLKAKWYRMIESGEKPEEYREIKHYWAFRLVEKEDQNGARLQTGRYLSLKLENA